MFARSILVALSITLSGVAVATPEFTVQTAYEFMAAQTKAYKSGDAEDIEAFVAFLADEVMDVHVAYNRQFSGKGHFRKNMPIKAKALIEYDKQVMQVILGTNVAVIVYSEQTRETKRDGRVNSYSGRTIMVVDFNEDGLITTIRRYQD